MLQHHLGHPPQGSPQGSSAARFGWDIGIVRVRPVPHVVCCVLLGSQCSVLWKGYRDSGLRLPRALCRCLACLAISRTASNGVDAVGRGLRVAVRRTPSDSPSNCAATRRDGRFVQAGVKLGELAVSSPSDGPEVGRTASNAGRRLDVVGLGSGPFKLHSDLPSPRRRPVRRPTSSAESCVGRTWPRRSAHPAKSDPPFDGKSNLPSVRPRWPREISLDCGKSRHGADGLRPAGGPSDPVGPTWRRFAVRPASSGGPSVRWTPLDVRRGAR